MAPQPSPDSPLMAHVKRLWIHGFLVGFGVVLTILLICFYIWGWPSAPEGQKEPKPPLTRAPAAPPAPAAKAPPPAVATAKPPVALQTELAAVLARLAEAHQKKDLPQLLSLYAPTFPDLEQKAREISRTWTTHDYLSLRFRIEETKSQDPTNVFTKVIWEATTRNLATKETSNLTKTYRVGFSKDSGHWRIKSLAKAP